MTPRVTFEFSLRVKQCEAHRAPVAHGGGRGLEVRCPVCRLLNPVHSAQVFAQRQLHYVAESALGALEHLLVRGPVRGDMVAERDGILRPEGALRA